MLTTVRYAKKYCYVLFQPNKASELQTFSNAKRRLTMAALSNLSKYLGVYGWWKYIIESAGLKWGKRSKLKVITDILNFDMEDVKQWLIEVIQKLPKPHSTVIVFNALTGLRPSEGCMSCKLISQLSSKGELGNYLDEELMMLQHFRYKELFLRKSKNAYVSFITDDLLGIVLETKPEITYFAMVRALQRRGYKSQLNNLRKLYATTLREHLPTEIIDLLQGRVNQSVFLRYYYKPTLNQIREKTLKAIEPLQNELLTRLVG